MRILCVDDDRDTADSSGVLLKLLGYDVRVCYGAAEAIAAAASFRPHACLLDLKLPAIDGCELARRLRALAREEPPLLIAASAYGNEQARRRTAAAGFDLHLVKPLDLAALPGAFARLQRRAGGAGWR